MLEIKGESCPNVPVSLEWELTDGRKWNGKFADAMGRMSLLGVPGGSSNLVDCTNALPKSTNSKRDFRVSDMFKPRH